MTDVVVYGLNSKQDLSIGDNETFTVTLADGSVATVDKISLLDFFANRTTAALPAAGTAGRLARRSDGIRGLVLDNGSAWNNVSGDVADVKEFGAKGDGFTDDTAAIQAAVDSLTAGTVRFPSGNFKASGIQGKSNINFAGLGPVGASTITGSSGQPILSFDTSSAMAQFVLIQGLTFAGAGAKAIYGTSLNNYLSTCQIRNNHFSAELAEGIYGNLILSDIENNDFGLFGTAGANSRHIYSVGTLTGLASNINRLTNNRFYHCAGAEAIHFEAGYMLYLCGNNIERNDGTTPVIIKGMYGVVIRDNWFEQNAGTYQVSLTNDPGNINGNYIVDVTDNWFDMSHAGNATVFFLDGATAALDIVNNAGVMSNAQFLTYYNGSDHDNIGLRTCFGNRMVGTYVPPIRHFLEGAVTAATLDLLLDNAVAFRLLNSANANRIAIQLTNFANAGLVSVFDSSQLQTGAISGGSTKVFQAQDGIGGVKASLGTDGFVGGTDGLKIADIKVVGIQQAAIANSTSTSDVVARVNDILTAMRAHGLIGP